MATTDPRLAISFGQVLEHFVARGKPAQPGRAGRGRAGGCSGHKGVEDRGSRATFK
jgi:hypothetical protein